MVQQAASMDPCLSTLAEQLTPTSGKLTPASGKLTPTSGHCNHGQHPRQPDVWGCIGACKGGWWTYVEVLWTPHEAAL